MLRVYSVLPYILNFNPVNNTSIQAIIANIKDRCLAFYEAIQMLLQLKYWAFLGDELKVVSHTDSFIRENNKIPEL